MTSSAQIRSRRQPKLRVVGSERDGVRHAGIALIAETAWVLEVWSFSEFARLPEWERPATVNAIFLPGLGYAVFRMPSSWMEREDIRDIQHQAEAHWLGKEGYR